ncbi:nicotinate-nucleotide--dimethylbenzimidazole phosphoribosyltransferase [Roseimaritima ulvae]|uniref:Nicotinate-nucleotide--dimethylbenzimidazole phosphoribosyltransferase n=1 Tax=Roseimaritima ulvae TaxID=980254 RepID=A0A5B9QL19_9BACT|nr:nicotinate-nucleotide--dimethylbenzimidazole phosphoribosyltransferase [Roseimaritima ulvae]QEG38205.1 Nicotinate-nucleotide--dimethylbenzimidazole phosphoribosyltransferase [Roseimaritima ulvae]
MPNSCQSIDTARVQARLDNLCKPPGSLGQLEAVAQRLCLIQQTLAPQTRPRQVTVFAADHGVTAEGVTAWPSAVTAAVVRVMQTGRTASGVFAQSLGCDYEVVDVGLLRPLPPCGDTYIDAAERRGSGNLLHEAALDVADFDHAWQVGVQRAAMACEAGKRLLIGGEMGIGNTTSASCLIGLFCKCDRNLLVGRGAGIDDEQLERKRAVVDAAIRRTETLKLSDAKRIACQVGGLEIVALAGFFAEGAKRGATVLVDGLIATSAALVADAIVPETSKSMIAGHRSTEPGHVVALAKLGLTPVLDLQMRLGEATGALAALPMLDLAAAMIRDMGTLDELAW